MGCDRLPRQANGKEAVAGFESAEGSRGSVAAAFGVGASVWLVQSRTTGMDDEQERRSRLLPAETGSFQRAARPAAHCSLGRNAIAGYWVGYVAGECGGGASGV